MEGAIRSGSDRPSDRLGVWALLVALLAPLFVSDRAAAAVPDRFWGVIPATSASDAEFERMRRGGVDSVRLFLSWSDVQPAAGIYDWSSFDARVAPAVRHEVEVLPFIYGTPSWVAPRPNMLPVGTARQRQAWRRFLKAAVRRYGPRGSFWEENSPLSSHPVPRRPIRTWQIWNEQNTRLFSGMPSPRKYAILLRISRHATRRVDPGSRLILGGMLGLTFAKPPRGYDAAQFLNRLYRFKGTKAAWTAVALHPYVNYARRLEAQLETLRRVLRKHRDANKQVWITEIGWGSDPPKPNLPYDDFDRGIRGQARQLHRAFSLVRRSHGEFNLKRIYWFSWKDQPDDDFCSFCDSTGLFYRDLRAKPSWHRFMRFAGCFGRPATILGTAGRDVLRGTGRRDVIVGLGGNDRLVGRGGSDLICGGGGRDRLVGGAGNDRIDGGTGNDRIYLQAGADKGRGGFGADVLAGSFGADVLLGGGGRDRLLGGKGNDRLFGQNANDILLGGDGKDFLRGGRGRDRLSGGSGRNNVRQ